MNTKKKLLVKHFGMLLVLVCILGTGFPASAGPQAVLPENSYEFSSALEGSEVAHDFIIHNEGDEPLRILKINSG